MAGLTIQVAPALLLIFNRRLRRSGSSELDNDDRVRVRKALASTLRFRRCAYRHIDPSVLSLHALTQTVMENALGCGTLALSDTEPRHDAVNSRFPLFLSIPAWVIWKGEHNSKWRDFEAGNGRLRDTGGILYAGPDSPWLGHG